MGRTDRHARGQVFGLAGTGPMLGQAVGAVIAGGIAQRLGAGSDAAARTMLVMAVLSIIATLTITPGFSRSHAQRGLLPRSAH